MTPQEIEQRARTRLNAINDDYWSQSEILDYLYDGIMEAAMECDIIENKYETTSVADQSEYTIPTKLLKIKAVYYDKTTTSPGRKLKPINNRQRDLVNLSESIQTTVGRPAYYNFWDNVIELVPTPSQSGLTIVTYAIDMPDTIELQTVLQVPVEYHPRLINYVVLQMLLKEGHRMNLINRYEARWEADKKTMRAQVQKRRSKDQLGRTTTEEEVGTTDLGIY